MVKGALVGDGPDGRTVGEGACFIVAEATGEEELVKSFRSVGDLDGSGYALPRFMETVFPSQIRRSSSGFKLAEKEERTRKSIDALDQS
jgi:hypothetical protein